MAEMKLQQAVAKLLSKEAPQIAVNIAIMFLSTHSFEMRSIKVCLLTH
jgi:hypothetical protein